MKATLGALLLTTMFVLSALPATAATLPSNEQMVVWLKSDGTSGISPLSKFTDFQALACSGDSPLQNSCELKSTYPNGFGGWLVGWMYPGSFQGTPVATVALSTEVKMTTSTGGFVDFGCDWFPNVAGSPRDLVRCQLLAINGNLYGTLDAKFHNGILDPAFIQSSLPNVGNDIEEGVGHWDAILWAV